MPSEGFQAQPCPLGAYQAQPQAMQGIPMSLAISGQPDTASDGSGLTGTAPVSSWLPGTAAGHPGWKVRAQS